MYGISMLIIRFYYGLTMYLGRYNREAKTSLLGENLGWGALKDQIFGLKLMGWRAGDTE